VKLTGIPSWHIDALDGVVPGGVAARVEASHEDLAKLFPVTRLFDEAAS